VVVTIFAALTWRARGQKFIEMAVVASTLSEVAAWRVIRRGVHGPILASLTTEFMGTYPHDALRGLDSGQRKARGVWRQFLCVVCESSF
jgi:hypothetical protein